MIVVVGEKMGGGGNDLDIDREGAMTSKATRKASARRLCPALWTRGHAEPGLVQNMFVSIVFFGGKLTRMDWSARRLGGRRIKMLFVSYA